MQIVNCCKVGLDALNSKGRADGDHGQLPMLLAYLDLHYSGLDKTLPSLDLSDPDKLLRTFSSNLGIQVGIT